MSLDIAFPCDRRAPARARDAVRELGGQLDPQLAADVELLVSELVSNSVKYAGDGDVHLSALSDRPRHVWVEVSDEGEGFVAIARDRSLTEIGGWGLHLVASVADRWGVLGGSTRVWFEIDR
jgi:anti-sigma regulatory factor (Ser/Thr protein kinase)